MKQVNKFQNLRKPVKFSKEQRQYIKGLELKSGKEWDIKDKIMNQIKADIKSQLMEIQEGFCIYCGQPIGIVGTFDREHIVDKGNHPELMFEPLNLALACKTCNGPTRKGKKNIIISYNRSNYKLCTFKIIHPHLDKREDHIEFADDEITLKPKNHSEKGKETIKMFDLNNDYLLSSRGHEVIFNFIQVSKSREEIIEKITKMNHTI